MQPGRRVFNWQAGIGLSLIGIALLFLLLWTSSRFVMIAYTDMQRWFHFSNFGGNAWVTVYCSEPMHMAEGLRVSWHPMQVMWGYWGGRWAPEAKSVVFPLWVGVAVFGLLGSLVYWRAWKREVRRTNPNVR